MEEMVKISLISGFLGAGKTTFIKKLLGEGFFGRDPILVENDYGALGIDSPVMAASGVRVRELTAGCICCSLSGDLVVGLEELISREKPAHIIIEPSGVGKLSEILAALRELNVPYEKHLVATVVDVKRFDYNDRYIGEYFWDQIRCADVTILSKTSGLSDSALLHICTEIQQKAADKKIISVPWEQLYTPLLKELGQSQPAPLKMRMRPLHRDLRHKKTLLRGAYAKAAGMQAEREGAFGSWSMRSDRVYSDSELQELLTQLEDPERCGTVIRAKGLLKTEDGGALLDYVPEHGTITSAFCEEGRLMVVGMDLDCRGLEEMFR